MEDYVYANYYSVMKEFGWLDTKNQTIHMDDNISPMETFELKGIFILYQQGQR